MQKNKTVKLLEKTYIKANGVTLYQFQSGTDANKQYFITAKGGVIDGATHTDCDGFYYRGTCAHTAYILRDIYDVHAAAVQVLADAEIGDAYEQVAYVPAAKRAESCRHCGGNHHSNECPY